jgi:hypothetical protein
MILPRQPASLAFLIQWRHALLIRPLVDRSFTRLPLTSTPRRLPRSFHTCLPRNADSAQSAYFSPGSEPIAARNECRGALVGNSGVWVAALMRELGRWAT